MSELTNNVRQILMNELGLSRNSVRVEASVIIKEAVAAQVRMMINNGVLERLVHEEFIKIVQESRWDKQAITKMVTAEAEKQMRAYVAPHLDFSIALKEKV